MTGPLYRLRIYTQEALSLQSPAASNKRTLRFNFRTMEDVSQAAGVLRRMEKVASLLERQISAVGSQPAGAKAQEGGPSQQLLKSPSIGEHPRPLTGTAADPV